MPADGALAATKGAALRKPRNQLARMDTIISRWIFLQLVAGASSKLVVSASDIQLPFFLGGSDVLLACSHNAVLGQPAEAFVLRSWLCSPSSLDKMRWPDS